MYSSLITAPLTPPALLSTTGPGAHSPLQDYNITFYCAEVVNTLTNLVFMWLGIKGLRNVLACSHSRVFILVYLGYIVVGLGSMAFHTTLKC